MDSDISFVDTLNVGKHHLCSIGINKIKEVKREELLKTIPK